MKREKLLIIGAVAAGTKAGSKAKRQNPNVDITIITMDEDISYAGCGLPYFIGDIIKEKKELVVRNPEDFKIQQDIEVLIRHKAIKILPEGKSVIVLDMVNNVEKQFEYDKLVIATGASPFVPPIEGVNLNNIFTLRTVKEAVGIKKLLDEGKIKNAVVVGGGFIGLETAENLVHRGVNTTIVELADYILPGFDPEMALLAQSHLIDKGVNIITKDRVVSFEGNSEGRVIAVNTPNTKIETDLVVLSIGVRPNVAIAKEIGIELGVTGAIKVNDNMETNLEDIFAVGDCAENVNLITNKPAWYPMGSTSNKTGRIAGINLYREEKDSIQGVLGTTVVKLFDFIAAKTGLSERDARKEGYDVDTILVPANDKAHYYPGYKQIITKLIVDKSSHRVLGAQVVGEGVVDKPIDIIATAMTFGAKVEDLTKLDLAYAPPFSMAMSSVIVAANVMINKMEGVVKTINSIQLQEVLESEEVVIVDTRPEINFFIRSIPGSINIPSEQLENRANELDKQKTIILVCKIGKNAYLSYNKLSSQGFGNIRILEGGIEAYPFELQ